MRTAEIADDGPMIDVLVDPLRFPELWVGSFAGVVAAVAGARVVRRTPGRGPAPIAGLLLAAAASVGVVVAGTATLALVAGLALATGAWWLGHGAVGTAAGPGRWAVSAALLLGGLAVVTADAAELSAPGRVLVVAAGAATVLSLLGFDRRSPHATVGPVLVALTAGGVYATIPDTEAARVLMGAAVPVAVLGWPARSATLGGGATVLAGLLVWVVAAGGHVRPGAVVGAFACLGLLAADPAARLVSGGSLLDRLPRSPAGTVALLVAQTVVVLVAARVAGPHQSASDAAAVAVPLLAAAVGVLALGGLRRLRPPTG